MDKNKLDCVAQDVHSVLCLATYAMQDILMNCDTTTGLGEGITFCMDAGDMDAAYGVLEALRSARDKLNQALQSV